MTFNDIRESTHGSKSYLSRNPPQTYDQSFHISTSSSRTLFQFGKKGWLSIKFYSLHALCLPLSSLFRIHSAFSGTFLFTILWMVPLALTSPFLKFRSILVIGSTQPSIIFPHMSTHTGGGRTLCVSQHNTLKRELDSLSENTVFTCLYSYCTLLLCICALVHHVPISGGLWHLISERIWASALRSFVLYYIGTLSAVPSSAACVGVDTYGFNLFISESEINLLVMRKAN